eukprot:gene12020-13261_t
MAVPVITVYKNGDSYYNGKRLVLNPKEIRNFDAFLDRVTKDIRSKTAVRSIRTPSHGHRVGGLDKLENGGIYVAVGPERFKKLEYKEVSTLPSHRQKPPEQIIKPVVHSRVIVSGRAKKVAAAETSANKTIFVYRNGDDKHAAFKILLDKRLLHTDMDTILQFITDKVNLRTGAVKSLYTLDGVEVVEPSKVKSMDRYVAVGFGRRFRKLAYSDDNANSLTPRRGPPKGKSRSSEPPVRKKKQKPPIKAMSQDYVKSGAEDIFDNLKRDDSHSPEKNKDDSLFDQIVEAVEDSSVGRGITDKLSFSRESTKHDNEAVESKPKKSIVKEPSQKKDNEKEAKAKSERKKSDPKKKPLKAKKTTSSNAGSVKSKDEDGGKKKDDVEENNVKNEDSTVFKATGVHAESASTVNDNKDTNVDKPIDMLPAAEVEEELEDGGGNEDEVEELETSKADSELQKNEGAKASNNRPDSAKNSKPSDSREGSVKSSSAKPGDTDTRVDSAKSKASARSRVSTA